MRQFGYGRRKECGEHSLGEDLLQGLFEPQGVEAETADVKLGATTTAAAAADTTTAVTASSAVPGVVPAGRMRAGPPYSAPPDDGLARFACRRWHVDITSSTGCCGSAILRSSLPILLHGLSHTQTNSVAHRDAAAARAGPHDRQHHAPLRLHRKRARRRQAALALAPAAPVVAPETVC